ncbi:MAG: hypothetical protein J4478_04685 [Candidatus Diapherotrites archaeon]|uniref:Uncharacterized protein n=1 Tax=Candidatus Iainarchaeum sp. TaxID=3101447 RepID=A0A7J4KU76_9ARCH|nr:MAG: hypothetical protein QT12_C0006G0007 [archaeon GW2011_AR21]MBS3058666.1 hypothetical protein [Candidatus Diapherotrites archaeon]HIH21754.1 hypothetical protein [Candidatus Diapherotrites archaeon]HIH33563.1 hypothetical protein [Candidatus Diapherotrites archaeon]
MGLNKTSVIAIVIGLVILVGEFWLVFGGAGNAGKAVLDMIVVIVNGLIMAFALLLLVIGVLLLSS